MIADPVREAVEKILSAGQQNAVRIRGAQPVGGGCINSSYCIKTGSGKYFLKWNDATRYPGMFEAEARGLALLLKSKTLRVPVVLDTGITGSDSFILMEWIEAGKKQRNFWMEFGRKLAHLHKNSNEKFGLDHDNYIGSLKQKNNPHASWSSFFYEERLLPQFEMARYSGLLDKASDQQLQQLAKLLPEIMPDEASSFLHGDLWTGNYLVDEKGEACLMDPAVYYGHREVDLAMTRLFGGFDEEFYMSYEEEYPLKPGFENRVDLHNLYPLLVHVNLFGGGYVSQVKSILSRF